MTQDAFQRLDHATAHRLVLNISIEAGETL